MAAGRAAVFGSKSAPSPEAVPFKPMALRVTTTTVGGGGRIAIHYQTRTFAGPVTAWGGAHGNNGVEGGAGTIYWKRAGAALGNVVLDNNGQAGAYTPADLVNGTGLVVTLTNGAQVVVAGGETWAVNQLSVGTNCTVWCYSANNASQVNTQ